MTNVKFFFMNENLSHDRFLRTRKLVIKKKKKKKERKQKSNLNHIDEKLKLFHSYAQANDTKQSKKLN